VEIDATSIGLENWISDQMVYIYQHGSDQEEVCFFPIFSKKDKSDKEGKAKM
jgi:hypothetical protein